MASIINSVRDNAYAAKARSVDAIDNTIPPKRRQELVDSVKDWSRKNPKLAGFVFAQLVLSGIPLLAFALFAGSVFISSLATCLIVGLVVALTFTAVTVGAALLILLPTLFLTSIAATFVFVWGLLGFLVTKRFNNVELPDYSVHDARERVREVTNEGIARVQGAYKANVEPLISRHDTSQNSTIQRGPYVNKASQQNSQLNGTNGVSRESQIEKEERTNREKGRELLQDIDSPLKIETQPSGTITIAPLQ